MISPSFEFSQFAASVRGKAYDDVIFDAQEELIAAWRQAVHGNKTHENDIKQIETYQKTLKEFISFLRYSVSTVHSDNENYRYFIEVKEHMPKKEIHN